MHYTTWSFQCECDEQFVVYPDGCRDLLVINQSDCSKEIRVTDWDLCPRYVSLTANTTVTGYRMKPGIGIHSAGLDLSALDDLNMQSQLDELAQGSEEISDAVASLSCDGDTLEQVARRVGVSSRTLQRRFKALGLPSPDFWRLLGRARRTAIALTSTASDHELATASEIALEFGYSDQAHMSRECQRWFQHSPERLRNSSQLKAQLAEPGIGNWHAARVSACAGNR